MSDQPLTREVLQKAIDSLLEGSAALQNRTPKEIIPPEVYAVFKRQTFACYECHWPLHAYNWIGDGKGNVICVVCKGV